MQKIYSDTRAVRDAIPRGKTVTLVGGGFDLLHVGHLHLLEYAKTLENTLVVCILSDYNIRSRKGSSRPIIGEAHRASMVAALECVDYVYVSAIDTSHQDTLSVIQPSSVVFGIEHTDSRRATAKKRDQFFKTYFPHVTVHYLERFSDNTISTSSIIQKIKSSNLLR